MAMGEKAKLGAMAPKGHQRTMRLCQVYVFSCSMLQCCSYMPNSEVAIEDWFNFAELAAFLELAIGLESKWI